jgi:opacity protein-like surface antigen
MLKMRVLLLSGLLFLASISTSVAENNPKNWGVGTFLAYNLPVLQLQDRFSAASKYGASWQYLINPKLFVEAEYHRSQFLNGKLAKRPFTWSVDSQPYVSPQAKSELRFNGVSLNLLIFHSGGPAFRAKTFPPYLEAGVGFYSYRSENRNFIYPGQTKKPLNTALVLQPQIDTKTVLTVNFGYGIQAFLGDRVALDLRARYNLVVGDLRPMYDWGIKSKTFPMHLFDVGAGLKFYFSK